MTSQSAFGPVSGLLASVRIEGADVHVCAPSYAGKYLSMGDLLGDLLYHLRSMSYSWHRSDS